MQEVNFFPVKSNILPGSSYDELKKICDVVFATLKRKGSKKEYVRSAYFKKQKVFFDYFYIHLFQKPRKQRTQRLKFFLCALELIKKSRFKPTIKENPNKKSETLFRFYGITKDKKKFVVQIKKTKISLQCISLFPWK